MKRWLILICLLLPCLGAAEGELVLTATVSAQESALLPLPLDGEDPVLILEKGDVLTITALGSSYCEAIAGDTPGYIPLTDIAFDILEGQPTRLGEVDVSPTNLMFGRMTLREEASGKSKGLCKLAKGRLVLLLGEEGDMYHLAVPGYIGYGLKKQISTAVEPLPYTIYYVNNDAPVHLRLDSRYGENWVVTKLEPGTPVQLIKNPNGWAQVEVGGQRGRMVAEFLSEEPPQ